MCFVLFFVGGGGEGGGGHRGGVGSIFKAHVSFIFIDRTM